MAAYGLGDLGAPQFSHSQLQNCYQPLLLRVRHRNSWSPNRIKLKGGGGSVIDFRVNTFEREKGTLGLRRVDTAVPWGILTSTYVAMCGLRQPE